MCGQQVREALPEGGKVIIAIGSIEKENGHRRRQGVIDELLERTFEPNRPTDPVDAPLKGPKYTIVATLIDNLDAAARDRAGRRRAQEAPRPRLLRRPVRQQARRPS